MRKRMISLLLAVCVVFSAAFGAGAGALPQGTEQGIPAGRLSVICRDETLHIFTFFRQVCNLFRKDHNKLVTDLSLLYVIYEGDIYTMFTDERLNDRVSVALAPSDFWDEIRPGNTGFTEQWYTYENGKTVAASMLYYPNGGNAPLTSTPQTPGRYCCVVTSDDGGYRDYMFVELKERGNDREICVVAANFNTLSRSTHYFHTEGGLVQESVLRKYYTSVQTSLMDASRIEVNGYEFQNGEFLMPEGEDTVYLVFLRPNEYSLGFCERYGNIPHSWNLLKYEDGGHLTLSVKNGARDELPAELEGVPVNRVTFVNCSGENSTAYLEKYFSTDEITEIKYGSEVDPLTVKAYRNTETVALEFSMRKSEEMIPVQIEEGNPGVTFCFTVYSEVGAHLVVENSEHYVLESYEEGDMAYLRVTPRQEIN